MTWLYLGILSGLLLGLYDLFKKSSVNANAVLPVLLISNFAAALVWAPLTALSYVGAPGLLHRELQVETISAAEHMPHALLLLKSALIGASWLMGYFAVKHLPISIGGNFRAIGPVFTIVGAFILFRETPDGQQSLGIVLTLGAFARGKARGYRFLEQPDGFGLGFLESPSGPHRAYTIGICSPTTDSRRLQCKRGSLSTYF